MKLNDQVKGFRSLLIFTAGALVLVCLPAVWVYGVDRVFQAAGA